MRGRKRRNYIMSLNVDGHIIADHEGIEKAMFDHFSSVFGMAMSGGTMLNFDALGIQVINLDDLNVDINTEETYVVIKE